MTTESLATVSFCERRRREDPLFQIALTPWETSVLGRALQWRPEALPAPQSYSYDTPRQEPRQQVLYYEAEWVTPDGDGWAPWSEADAVAARPVYARTVLAVPDGDGWAACDEEMDEDAGSGYWLDSRQLSQLVAHFSTAPALSEPHVHTEAGGIKRCVEMFAHAMDRGMDIHIAYQH
jgi:hypothetical protein